VARKESHTQGTFSPGATTPLPKIVNVSRKALGKICRSFRKPLSIFGSGAVASGDNVPCVCKSFMQERRISTRNSGSLRGKYQKKSSDFGEGYVCVISTFDSLCVSEKHDREGEREREFVCV